MASTSGQQNNNIVAALSNDTASFSLFQAIRLLELIGDKRFAEVLSFKASYSNAFPTSEIAQIDMNQATLSITPLAFNLAGTGGILPDFYLDVALQMERAKNTSWRDFIDIFYHRQALLFYYAWSKYRLPIVWEKALTNGGTDPISMVVMALAGSNAKHDTAQHSPFFSGLLARQIRSVVVVEAMLTSMMACPIVIEQFQSRWIGLAPSEQTIIGQQKTGRFTQLGKDFVIGQNICDNDICLYIRPASYIDFLGLMPNGTNAILLAKYFFALVGDMFTVNYKLNIEAAMIPNFILNAGNIALGWNSWLGAPAELCAGRDYTILFSLSTQ